MDESAVKAGVVLRTELADEYLRVGRLLMESGKVLVNTGRAMHRLRELHERSIAAAEGYVTRDPSLQDIEIVLRLISIHFGVTIDEITISGSRRRPVLRARQASMYLMRQLFGLSYPAIAKYFTTPSRDDAKGRPYDHTTVMAAVRRVKSTIADNVEVSRQIDGLAAKIKIALDAHVTLPDT